MNLNLLYPTGYIFMGILGAVVGSFLNVCIYRIPRSQSIVTPKSHCPVCGSPIAFYDNIPLISYFFLRGRCRSCRSRISPRYPLVEGLNAAFYTLLFHRFGWTLSTLVFALFVSLLLVISFVDLDFRIIPDCFTLSGIIFGLAFSFIVEEVTPLQSILGILVGGGFLYLVAFTYEKIAKKEGMGGGDIKLMAMIGAFSGWQAIPFVILISSFAGALIGVIIMIVMKKGIKFSIPFGPFLSFSSVLYIFFGPELIHWYLGLGRIGGV